MRHSRFLALLSGAVGIGVQLAGCDTSVDCNDTRSCGTALGGEAGATALGGNPGVGGATFNSGGAGSGVGGAEAGGSAGGASSSAGAPEAGSSQLATGGASGASGAGNETSAGAGGAPPPPCDPTAAPSDEACVIEEQFAVFVDVANAHDAHADGTRAHAFSSIGDAVAHADGKRVYVCATNGDYAEQLSFADSPSPLELYGGFTCGDWSYSTTARAKLKSSASSALVVQGAKHGLLLQDFELSAANASGTDASGNGASSIAALITDSHAVTLRRVKISAGAGAKGRDGADGVQGSNGSSAGAAQNGKSAVCGDAAPASQTGGEWAAQVCGSLGGTGGLAFKNPDSVGSDGYDGTPDTNVTPASFSNKGPGAKNAGASVLSGGLAGSPGNSGALAGQAAAIGSFNATGYTPAAGHNGGDGFPGQGGGGGGATRGNGTCVGASGGAGGMAGCGGKGGKGGAGGGASIALLSSNSQLTLDRCELVASQGGHGGNGGKAGAGGLGQPGGSGGLGSTDNGIGNAGQGGPGGNGGNGGSGSGGSGGPSIALVYDGAQPQQTECTLTPGSGGGRGLGGVVGTQRAPDGSAGQSSASLAL